MKTKITSILATLIALTVLGGGSAFAKQSSVEALGNIQGITLTEEQKVGLENSDATHRGEMRRFRADLADARQMKNTLLKDDDFKKAKVQEQIRKIMAIKTDMEIAKLEKLDRVRGILTNDQWRLLNEHLRNQMNGMKWMQKNLGEKRDRKGAPGFLKAQ